MLVLGVLGILLAIAALVVLAWRRWNAIVCALIATLIIGVFNGFGIWGTLTDYFLPAAGNWVTTFILMFLTSAMYAKVIGDSGAADRIAQWVLDKAGERFIYPVLILICMILTYGGINALVIVFVFWPLAIPIARAMDKPRYIFLTIMYMGLLGGANMAMPGSPQTGNVAAAQILGTSVTAAPGWGIIATVLWFAFDVWFIYRLDRWAAKRNHTFEEGVGLPIKSRSIETCPSMVRSIIPIVVLLALFVILGNGFGPIPKMSATTAVVTANVIATIICLALNFKFYENKENGLSVGEGMKKSVFDGLMSGLSPASAMFCMVAFASVLSATPAFQSLVDIAMGSAGNPYFQGFIATQLLGVICGSAGATSTAVCNTFGAQWLAIPGVNADALTRIVSIGAAGCSTVPYSGGLFVNLDVTGCKMKHVWPQQFIACAIPAIVLCAICAGLASVGLVF